MTPQRRPANVLNTLTGYHGAVANDATSRFRDMSRIAGGPTRDKRYGLNLR